MNAVLDPGAWGSCICGAEWAIWSREARSCGSDVDPRAFWPGPYSLFAIPIWERKRSFGCDVNVKLVAGLLVGVREIGGRSIC